jgi:hypothetical protein
VPETKPEKTHSHPKKRFISVFIYASDLSQTPGKELIDKFSDSIEIFNAGWRRKPGGEMPAEILLT